MKNETNGVIIASSARTTAINDIKLLFDKSMDVRAFIKLCVITVMLCKTC